MLVSTRQNYGSPSVFDELISELEIFINPFSSLIFESLLTPNYSIKANSFPLGKDYKNIIIYNHNKEIIIFWGL